MNTAFLCNMRGLAPGLVAVVLLGGGCGGPSVDPDQATVETAEPGPTALPEPTPGQPTATADSPAASATPTEGWGTLRGQVQFTGEVPVLPALVSAGETDVKDAAVCAVDGVPDQRLVVDPDSRGVQYAIVFLPEPTRVHEEARSARQAEVVPFDQKGCLFAPHVLAVMRGARVELRSSDPVSHNVNSLLRDNRFNLTISPGQEPIIRELTRAERRPGQVVCDIHPWMNSWWMVCENPYFAVTDAQGRYEIPLVPAGSQQVVVWQEAAQDRGFGLTSSTGQPVVIKADETVEVLFELRADLLNNLKD